MTLSLNCKDAGDPVCTHTRTGETEEELLANAKKHGMEVHGYTEQYLLRNLNCKVYYVYYYNSSSSFKWLYINSL